jgi:hypothetical protein
VPIPLVVSIVGDTKQLGRSLDDAGDRATGFGQRFDLGLVAKVASFGAVATVAVGGLLALGKAASDDAREAAALELAVKNAGAATGDWTGAIDRAIVAGEALAFSDSQVRESLTTLVAATGDMTRATEGLALAQDLARLKGIDLSTATDAVAKAQDGNATALARLLKLSTEGKDATDILAEAQRLGAGQAELYGDSQAGAADRAAIKLGELGEKVGTFVAPALEGLTDAGIAVIDWLTSIVEEHGPAFARGIDKVKGAIDTFMRGVSRVADFFANLIDQIGRGIDAVEDFMATIDSLVPKINGIPVFPHLPGLGGPGLEAATVGGPVSSSSATITINTGADPDAVVRALTRWVGRNGGPDALTRVLER